MVKSNVKKFNVLVSAIKMTFPPILIDESKHTIMVTYRKYFSTIFFKYKIQNVDMEGYYVCEKSKHALQIWNNIFSCELNTYISTVFMCDDNRDCPDGSH